MLQAFQRAGYESGVMDIAKQFFTRQKGKEFSSRVAREMEYWAGIADKNVSHRSYKEIMERINSRCPDSLRESLLFNADTALAVAFLRQAAKDLRDRRSGIEISSEQRERIRNGLQYVRDARSSVE